MWKLGRNINRKWRQEDTNYQQHRDIRRKVVNIYALKKDSPHNQVQAVRLLCLAAIAVTNTHAIWYELGMSRALYGKKCSENQKF